MLGVECLLAKTWYSHVLRLPDTTVAVQVCCSNTLKQLQQAAANGGKARLAASRLRPLKASRMRSRAATVGCGATLAGAAPAASGRGSGGGGLRRSAGGGWSGAGKRIGSGGVGLGCGASGGSSGAGEHYSYNTKERRQQQL